jgi:acetylornithine deacetylase
MLDDTRQILSDLVAFPTVSADSNLDIIGYLATRLEDCGARVEIMPDETGQKANIFATIGPEAEGGIVLSGHTDVVPVVDQDWTTNPFRLHERDGRLYGRGTCDMKGFIAATLAMAPLFAARATATPVHFSFTHDEEVGCLGARRLVDVLAARGFAPRLAIVGEPTEMRVIDGHKGCHEYSTVFMGLEGRGSTPDLGVNAVEYAARYAAFLLDLKARLKARAPASSRFDPPWTTLNVGAIHGGSAHNVIAPRAQIDWEMRPVQESDADFVKDALYRFCEEELLPAMRRVHPQAQIETHVIGEVAGLMPTDSNAARQLLMTLTGANRSDLVPFSTEAGLFQSLGMDVAICGPGSIAQAHKADEYVTLEQLSGCLDLLEKLTHASSTSHG